MGFWKKNKKEKPLPPRPEGVGSKEGVYYGWIARDGGSAKNRIQLYTREPRCLFKCFKEWMRGIASLPPYDFPQVTWESGPKKVKVTVEIIEE